MHTATFRDSMNITGKHFVYHVFHNNDLSSTGTVQVSLEDNVITSIDLADLSVLGDIYANAERIMVRDDITVKSNEGGDSYNIIRDDDIMSVSHNFMRWITMEQARQLIVRFTDECTNESDDNILLAVAAIVKQQTRYIKNRA